MSRQRRWLCHDCSREWVAVIAGFGGIQDACPMPDCSSLDIELVEYDASFPGGDIPRGTYQAMVPATTPPTLVQRFLGMFS